VGEVAQKLRGKAVGVGFGAGLIRVLPNVGLKRKGVRGDRHVYRGLGYLVASSLLKVAVSKRPVAARLLQKYQTEGS